MSGCASVNMATKEESAQAKKFNAPSQGNAGVEKQGQTTFNIA